jgi:hypothetical protein
MGLGGKKEFLYSERLCGKNHTLALGMVKPVSSTDRQKLNLTGIG